MIPGFRIIRELGRGGMATVYLAEQESLGREVALKILAPSLAADADFATRFVREARITAAFRHRHLLAVVDAGRFGDHLYLAMEYVPGGSAGSLRGGDPELIRRCLIDIAGALAYAHDRGVVHRDIKPENILQREDGSFLLSDFGIARSVDATRALTAPEAAIGTPSYMSPEQWRGAAVDGRADLYSLGIVAVELLTGAVPFTGPDGWSIGMQHMSAERPTLPAQFADWQPLIDRLLAIDPTARFADARALVEALGGNPAGTPSSLAAAPGLGTPTVALPLASTGTPTAALSPPSTATPLPQPPPNAFAIRGLIALALVALLALGAWWWTRPVPQTDVVVPPSTQPIAIAPVAVDKSIAVLPFRVLSTEPQDEFFADGLSEEILSSLASVPELRVTGRTSSFAWKGKDTDLREIAKVLNVAHLLEGSIRRAGTQLRISATLIAAGDGTTRWTKTFNRELKDAFAIQNEIALAVADQLSVSIGTSAPATLARLPEADRARYLEAIGQMNNYHAAGLASARATLEDLITTRSVGADAYSRLVVVLSAQMRRRELPFAEAVAHQQRLAAQLRERFPDSVESALVSAVLVQSRGEFDHRLVHFRESLQILEGLTERAPNEPAAAIGAAHAARVLRDYERAIRHAERAIVIDPSNTSTHFAKWVALGESGRVDEAVAGLTQLAEQHPQSTIAGESLPIWLIQSGHLSEALKHLEGCEAPRFAAGRCRYFRHYVLFSLGYQRAAEAELRLWRKAVPAEDATVSATESIYAGRVPEPAKLSNRAVAWLAASEALALGDQPRLLAWLELAGARDWLNEREDPKEFAPAAYRIGTWAVQSELLRAENPQLLAERFAATARVLATLPDQHLPFDSNAAVVAAVLTGDIEAAIRRLQVTDAISSLLSTDVAVSPSGRDLPIAKALRADARFAAMWARRAEAIQRERREVEAFLPDVQ